jgi:hypothetical protein
VDARQLCAGQEYVSVFLSLSLSVCLCLDGDWLILEVLMLILVFFLDFGDVFIPQCKGLLPKGRSLNSSLSSHDLLGQL